MNLKNCRGTLAFGGGLAWMMVSSYFIARNKDKYNCRLTESLETVSEVFTMAGYMVSPFFVGLVIIEAIDSL